jgi:hypothetical protein
MKNFTKRLAISTVAAGTLLATAFAPGAFAADGTSATVTGGSLSVTNAVADDFAGRSITGVAQTTTAPLGTFSVSDLTGSGAGWRVTAQATQFDGATDLAVGSLSLSQPTVASPNTDSPDPTVAGGPYTIDNGAVQVASAAVTNGMGVYDFAATTMTLSLPANVYADTYTSTVTISVVSGPTAP